MAPKISIIIPVYNGELYLSEAIESCLLQTFPDFEIIIVNDCSTDSSLRIAEAFAIQDARVKIITNSVNKKLPASLNLGHRAAKGTYITWTSDDNILKPKFLEKLVAELEKDQADIVYSNYDIIHTDGSLKRKHITGPTEKLLFGNAVGASFMYKRIVFEALEGYNEQLFLLEDYDFWLRASHTFKYRHLNENLYQYRLHPNSLTAGIQGDKEYNEKHKKGIVTMFTSLASVCAWQQETTRFLLANFKREPISIENYLVHQKTIKKDIFSFNPSHLDASLLLEAVLKVVRRSLVSEEENRNLKMLVQVLKKEPLVLFHKSFSKKVTLQYIKNSFFRK